MGWRSRSLWRQEGGERVRDGTERQCECEREGWYRIRVTQGPSGTLGRSPSIVFYLQVYYIHFKKKRLTNCRIIRFCHCILSDVALENQRGIVVDSPCGTVDVEAELLTHCY